jgi:MFS family permease
MTQVAVPWFVLQTTGSPARTGITGFFQFLPVVIAGFFGGTMVDRLGHRRMSVVADLASGVTVAAIPFFYRTLGLEFWHLLGLVFLGGLLDTPGMTARSALAPEVAARAGWTLERMSGVNAAVERGARLAGAPLAGILIATIGATNVLWIDAGTFLVSAAAIRIGVPARRTHGVNKALGYLNELGEGLRFLRRDDSLRAIMLTVGVTNFLDAATGILLPVYALEVYGSSVSLGLLLGAMAGGSVVAALVYAARGHGLARHRVFAACFTGVTLRYPVLALFPTLGVAVAGQALAGAAAGPINPVIDTVSYERVPAFMRGRVFGLGHAVAWTAFPLGVLFGGFLVEGVGLRAALVTIGLAYLGTTLTMWGNPALRAMDLTPSQQSLEVSGAN